MHVESRDITFQATFPGLGQASYEFSTQVVIVPNVFPYPACSGNGCYGTLL